MVVGAGAVIVAVVVIPQGSVCMTGCGSRWWFNLNQLQYYQQGSFSTQPLLSQPTAALGATITPESLVGRDMQFAIWGTGGYAAGPVVQWLGSSTNQGTLPVWYPNCTATVTCTDLDQGVFRIDLHGDGYHTPVVQRWQAWFDPIYTLPTHPFFLDVTNFVQITSPVETLSAQNTPNTITLTLDNHNRQYEQYVNANTPDTYLVNNVSTLLRGEVVLCLRTGYNTTLHMSDGSTSVSGTVNARGVFLCQQPESHDPVNRAWTRVLTGADLLSRLSGTHFTTAPCYLGASYDYALRSILAWGGINPIWFQTDSEFLTSSVANQSAMFSIDDPLRDYANAPFDPEFGINALDFYRQLCEQGVRADFRAQFGWQMTTLPSSWHTPADAVPLPFILFRWDVDAQLTLSPSHTFAGGEMATYDPSTIAMGDTHASISIAGKPNLLLVAGRDIDGKQIMAAAPANPVDTPGSWMHAASVRLSILHKPDLLTYDACQRCASWHWFTLLRPRLTVKFNTVDAIVSGIRPRDVVLIHVDRGMESDYHPIADFTDGNVLYKIDTITVTHCAETYLCEVTAVDLFLVPPSTQS